MPNQEVRFKLNESADIDALEIQNRNRKFVFVRNAQGDFVRQK